METPVATIVNTIHFSALVASVGGIRPENLILLSERQIRPHHADQYVGKGDHLPPSQSAQPLELDDAVALTAQQRSLQVHDSRVSRDVRVAQHALRASGTGYRREACDDRERGGTEAGAARLATLNQQSPVDRTDRHPSDQPRGSQIRARVTLKALSTDSESICPPIWSRSVVSSSGKSSTGFIIAINRLESLKGHSPQSCNAHIGSLADACQ
jgi:hypothetical protein